MNKLLLTISILTLLILSACAKEEVYACTMEAKACTDGSYVGRSGPNCEFEACPATSCDYNSLEKAYIGKSQDECAVMRFTCTAEREYFADECGCGCGIVEQEPTGDDSAYYMPIPREECSLALIQCPRDSEAFVDDLGCGCRTPASQEGKIKVTDCTPEQKAAQACTKEYMPVCGWSDPAKVQCFAYPCASTFGNKCEACANENTISWSEGECPES
jgi:hypothetical protein